MMKKTLILLLLSTAPICAKESSMLFGRPDQMRLAVNNRILADVNGKPITVMDVMKKMDMHFLQQFPQYAENASAKFQYYQVNWKAVLEELIEKELILADAKEAKLEVTGGDVREEIERMFGPNIVENLDKIGISYDEAKELIRDDIIIKRMSYYRINMKANQSVSPKDVRDAYEEYAKQNVRPDVWQYRMISVRGKDTTKNAEIANHLHQFLTVDGIEPSQLQKRLDSQGYSQDGVTFSISDVMKQSSKEVAEANRKILEELEEGEYSFPIAQKSRADNSMVFRIFHLQEKTPEGAVPFAEVEPELKDKLLDNALREARETYFARLRKHYNVHEGHLKEMVPEDFQPFSLQ